MTKIELRVVLGPSRDTIVDHEGGRLRVDPAQRKHCACGDHNRRKHNDDERANEFREQLWLNTVSYWVGR